MNDVIKLKAMKSIKNSPMNIFLLSVTFLAQVFVFHNATAQTPPGVSSLQKYLDDCSRQIAALEKQAESATDGYKKSDLYKQAHEKEAECVFEGNRMAASDEDFKIAPPLGRLGKNFVKSCEIGVAQREKDIEPVQDPARREAMLDELMQFSFKCIKETISDLYDPSLAFHLGGNGELRETYNFVHNCQVIVDLKNKEIQKIADPMVRFYALPDLVDFTWRCLKSAQSDLFDPAQVPALGSDELHETSNIVNNCRMAINDLKSSYDPLTCGTEAHNKRSDIIKKANEVRDWCNSYLRFIGNDPSIVADFNAEKPYDFIYEFCHYPVCGYVPDNCQEEKPAASQPTPDVCATVPEKEKSTPARAKGNVAWEDVAGTWKEGRWEMGVLSYNVDGCYSWAESEYPNEDANAWSVACKNTLKKQSRCIGKCDEKNLESDDLCDGQQIGEAKECARRLGTWNAAAEQCDDETLKRRDACRERATAIQASCTETCVSTRPEAPEYEEEKDTWEDVVGGITNCRDWGVSNAGKPYDKSKTDNLTKLCLDAFAKSDACRADCSTARSAGHDDEIDKCTAKSGAMSKVCLDTSYACQTPCDWSDETRDAQGNLYSPCIQSCVDAQNACLDKSKKEYYACTEAVWDKSAKDTSACQSLCVPVPPLGNQATPKTNFTNQPSAMQNVVGVRCVSSQVVHNGVSHVSALIDASPNQNIIADIVGRNNLMPVFGINIASPGDKIRPVSIQSPQDNIPQISIRMAAKAQRFSFKIGGNTYSFDDKKPANAADSGEDVRVLQDSLTKILSGEWNPPVKSVTLSVPAESSGTTSIGGNAIVLKKITTATRGSGTNIVASSLLLSSHKDKKTEVTLEQRINGEAVANLLSGMLFYHSDPPSVSDVIFSDQIPSVEPKRSDFIFLMDNIEVKHSKTSFGLAFDPLNGKKVIELYDGDVEITDWVTRQKLATVTNSFGSPIKRMEIDANGNLKEQIAIPQTEWADFVLKSQEKSSSAWLWILLIAVAGGGVGYLVYRKKDALMKMIKREPTL